MDIKIDSEAVVGIASAAIFDAMSQESRDSAIKQAIEHLMTPEKDRFGSAGKTPLQNAFDQAIYQAATKAVRDKIESDPAVSQAIYDMLGPLITPAVETTAKNYDHGLTEALGAALANWLNDEARKRTS